MSQNAPWVSPQLKPIYIRLDKLEDEMTEHKARYEYMATKEELKTTEGNL